MSSRCRKGVGSQAVVAAALALALSIAIAGCRQDQTPSERQAPPGGDRMEGVRQVTLRPGHTSPTFAASPNPLGGNPEVLKDGERLYKWMNCVGCHFEGGGGIGPGTWSPAVAGRSAVPGDSLPL